MNKPPAAPTAEGLFVEALEPPCIPPSFSTPRSRVNVNEGKSHDLYSELGGALASFLPDCEEYYQQVGRSYSHYLRRSPCVACSRDRTKEVRFREHSFHLCEAAHSAFEAYAKSLRLE